MGPPHGFVEHAPFRRQRHVAGRHQDAHRARQHANRGLKSFLFWALPYLTMPTRAVTPAAR